MTSFLIFIYWHNFVFVKLFLILVSILILKPLFCFMIKDLRPNGYDSFDIFKITYRSLTYFFVFIYILIFIGLILLIRIQRFGLAWDLKPYIKVIQFIYMGQDYFLLMLLFLLAVNSLFLFTGILKRIRDFFDLQLLKMHLHLFYHKDQIDLTEELSKTLTSRQEIMFNYSLYRRFLYFMCKEANLWALKDRICWVVILIDLFLENSKYSSISETFLNLTNTILNIILNIRYNFISLVFLLVYDLTFNNLIITKLFYFLPFYFVYVLWYKFITFQYKENAYFLYDLAFIVYEMYYKEDTIKYFHLDEKDWRTIGLYIRSGLKGEDDYYDTDAMSHAYRIRHYCRYVLIDKERQIYYNRATQDYITKKR